MRKMSNEEKKEFVEIAHELLYSSQLFSIEYQLKCINIFLKFLIERIASENNISFECIEKGKINE